MRALVVSVALIASVAPAHADDAAAKALFDQGKTLFAEGKYGEACAKLEASFKLSALSSTRGLLGACYEKVGRLASAWAAYRDSAAIAERLGNAERAQAARDKAAELEPRLARLTIDAAKLAAQTGVTVAIDGTAQPAAALNEALPIDGGPHVVTADGVGYKKWQTTVDIADGERQQLAVPALVADPAELEALAPAPRMSRQRKVALGVTGAGVATLAVAGVFGILAKVNWSSSNCADDGSCPDVDAKQQADGARRQANIATGVGLAGLVIAGAGVVMFAVAPKHESAPAVAPVVTPGGVAVVVEGRF